jgi:hypothetical protein
VSQEEACCVSPAPFTEGFRGSEHHHLLQQSPPASKNILLFVPLAATAPLTDRLPKGIHPSCNRLSSESIIVYQSFCLFQGFFDQHLIRRSYLSRL